MTKIYEALEQARLNQNKSNDDLKAEAARQDPGVTREMERILQQNQSEIYSLEGNLLSAARGGSVNTLFVTSSRAREGKTSAAVTMAYALATVSNERVLLIDGNLGAPKLHRIFDIEPSPGFTEFLLSEAGEEQVIRKSKFRLLSVMPCGGEPSAEADVFEPEVFNEKLLKLKSMFDFVIFDGDSVLSSSEAILAARHFDGIVLVVECERTKWEVLQLAKEKVLGVGGNVLGVILNKRRYYVPNILYGKI